MSRAIDLDGQFFGRLRVIARDKNRHGKARWLCVCECGNETVVFGAQLRSGKTQSCGCLHKDMMAVIGPRNWKRRRADND